MKCVVCGAGVEGDVCPVCGFPVVSFPGDREAGLQAIKPQIDACRDTLLKEISLGVITYRWADRDGVLEQTAEEKREIGAGTDLVRGAVWLQEEFARKPDAEEIEIRSFVRLRGTDAERTLRVPNLLDAKLQQIGAEIGVREGLWYRLALRNGLGERYSAWVPMFD